MMTYQSSDYRFVWHGGAYIDIYASEEYPIDCINVWDYAKDEARIDRTEFIPTCQEWLIDLS